MINYTKQTEKEVLESLLRFYTSAGDSAKVDEIMGQLNQFVPSIEDTKIGQMPVDVEALVVAHENSSQAELSAPTSSLSDEVRVNKPRVKKKA